jgi:hypothetical protein
MYRVLACFVILATGTCLAATQPSCRYFELPLAAHNHVATYESDAFPWKLSSTDLSGFVTVQDKRTGQVCRISTDSDSRPRVYANQNDVAVRITEISSDDIVFYVGSGCRKLEHPRPVHLASQSDKGIDKIFQRLGICKSDRPAVDSK